MQHIVSYLYQLNNREILTSSGLQLKWRTDRQCH